MKYNDVNPDFLTKENLSKDADFIDDASTFLYERTGNVYSDPEEVFDEYMEHMRSHDVNEATTVQDLIAVRRMDDATKAKTARLFHTYDKMNMFREDETLVDAVTRFGDYAEGILTAPSTYVSLFTAGAGKAGAVAGQQVAKAAVRKALIKGLSKQGMKRGAAVEGGIGLAQSGLQEATRAEADEDYEFSVGRVAATTGVSTLTGGALGYVGGRSGAKQAVKAERMAQIGAERTARKNQAAVKAAEQTIEKASDSTKRPLTKLFVEAGEDARKEMLPGVESALVQLDDATKKRITAAAIDVAEKGQLKPLKFADGTEERITETIARGIADGTVDATTFSSVINKYNLTSQQLALLFTADVSRAARTLQQASSVARVQKMAESIGKVTNRGIAEEGDLSRVLKGGFSEADIEDMTNYSRVLSSVGQSAQGFEQLRRGLMTTQLQTTQRNIAGGGMRVFVDEVENLISNSSKAVYKYATGKDVEFSVSTPSMIKYMYNRSEAQVIANAFSSNMPREAQRLFAQFVDAADATSMTGLGGFLAGVGRKANVLNQMSDNYYKKAIFAGQLERLTKAKFGRSVMDLMAKGEMDKITTDMYKNATTKAYELLYQKTPSTKTAAGHLANAYLRIDKQAGVGMLTGLVMPFPRFVFNQVQFMMERAPVIGLLMPAETKIDKAVRQLSGLGMVGGFALYRATQPEGSEWYEYTNERGQTADLRPMLAGLSPFVYMGDLLNRSMSGKLLPKSSKIVQDIQELAVGESLRVGAGSTLFDRIIPESFNALFTDKEMTVATSENLGKLFGDYVATFAYNMPTGLARDGLGLLDEEYAKIVETNGEVRFWDSFVMRATRGLPAPLRDRAINSLSGDTIPIESRPVIGKAEDTRVETPLSTSITGMNIQAPKSALEKELSRLAMSTYDIYRPNRFGPADVIVRKELGDVLNKESVKIMNSDRYKKLTDNGKRSMLTNRLKNIVNQVQSNAFEQVRKKIRSGEEKRFDEFTVDKFEYETSGKRDDRIQAEEFYRQKFDLPSDYVFKGKDYRGLIEALEVTQKKILRKNKGGLMSPRKLFDGGFIRSARDFYEEEGIIPKKEKEETSTFPSFEEMMNAEDITKDMTDFQREVYEASDLTPEKSKQILEAFPEYSDRILSNTSESNRDNALYALSEYKRILERSAYGDSDKGLMSRK